jgi:signal transduction histidine kinase
MTPPHDSAAENAAAQADFDRRKAFTRFGEQEAAVLASLHGVFERHADEIVDKFYEHLQQFDNLRPHLADPETVARLKGFQKGYLLSLATGDYGLRHADNRLAIGRVHDRIGLDPEWYLGSYAFYLDLLAPAICERHPDDSAAAVGATTALAKLMILDMQLVLDAYYGLREKRAVARSEQLAAVGELAASIAHEVRNPLAGMKGALQVLRKDLGGKPENQEVVEELLAQIDRLENLVRDLLTYARPRALRRQRFDLHEMLDRLLRMYKDQSDRQAITVLRTYGPGTGEMDADPTQMEQVFLNLIHNAMQAMESGGRLSVITRTIDGAIEITFRDTGRGIDPLDLPRIFQPFFTTKHRGSGLGLPIVSKIAESHGGKIEIASRVGKGTTATVTIPARHRA